MPRRPGRATPPGQVPDRAPRYGDPRQEVHYVTGTHSFHDTLACDNLGKTTRPRGPRTSTLHSQVAAGRTACGTCCPGLTVRPSVLQGGAA